MPPATAFISRNEKSLFRALTQPYIVRDEVGLGFVEMRRARLGH